MPGVLGKTAKEMKILIGNFMLNIVKMPEPFTVKQHSSSTNALGILTLVLEQNGTCQGIRSGVVNSRKYINERVIAILGFQVYIIADTLLQPTSKQSERNDWCDCHATAFNTGSSYPAKTGL